LTVHEDFFTTVLVADWRVSAIFSGIVLGYRQSIGGIWRV